MNRSLAPVIVIYFFLAAGFAMAQEKDDHFWHDDKNQIYRQELLSPEEREQYRQKLWELKTETERERVRDAYRQLVDERARSLGVPWVDNNGGEEKEGGKKWPEDGLRRWPEARSADNGLRRWNGKHPAAAKEDGKSAQRGGGMPGQERDAEEEKP